MSIAEALHHLMPEGYHARAIGAPAAAAGDDSYYRLLDILRRMGEWMGG